MQSWAATTTMSNNHTPKITKKIDIKYIHALTAYILDGLACLFIFPTKLGTSKKKCTKCTSECAQMRMGVTLCIHMHYLHMYALSAVPNMHLAYNVLSAYILVTVDPYKFFPNSYFSVNINVINQHDVLLILKQ
jgi:hypothetical protein